MGQGKEETPGKNAQRRRRSAQGVVQRPDPSRWLVAAGRRGGRGGGCRGILSEEQNRDCWRCGFGRAKASCRHSKDSFPTPGAGRQLVPPGLRRNRIVALPQPQRGLHISPLPGGGTTAPAERQRSARKRRRRAEATATHTGVLVPARTGPGDAGGQRPARDLQGLPARGPPGADHKDWRNRRLQAHERLRRNINKQTNKHALTIMLFVAAANAEHRMGSVIHTGRNEIQ
mmetsp:Transcript_28674/g.67363  ORF Transcript_28674/g.67363 Transcript_28674/m.67363 type:complete len:230 (-) Transcript_28674:44-733(-)